MRPQYVGYWTSVDGMVQAVSIKSVNFVVVEVSRRYLVGSAALPAKRDLLGLLHVYFNRPNARKSVYGGLIDGWVNPRRTSVVLASIP